MYVAQGIENIVDNDLKLLGAERFNTMFFIKGFPCDPFECYERECCIVIDITYNRRLSTCHYESKKCI